MHEILERERKGKRKENLFLVVKLLKFYPIDKLHYNHHQIQFVKIWLEKGSKLQE